MDAFSTSIADAGRLIGIGKTKLYELINSGKIETVRLGKRRLVRVSSLKRLVGEQ